MIEKKSILILLLCLFFLTIILTPINAQQETTRHVDVDGDQHPEFIIHWRYSDFPNNARADTVVGFVENSASRAWQTIIGEWHFRKPLDKGEIDIYINDAEEEKLRQKEQTEEELEKEFEKMEEASKDEGGA